MAVHKGRTVVYPVRNGSCDTRDEIYDPARWPLGGLNKSRYQIVIPHHFRLCYTYTSNKDILALTKRYCKYLLYLDFVILEKSYDSWPTLFARQQ